MGGGGKEGMEGRGKVDEGRRLRNAKKCSSRQRQEKDRRHRGGGEGERGGQKEGGGCATHATTRDIYGDRLERLDNCATTG